jgi:DNA-binding transcriptional ArsR family regulator
MTPPHETPSDLFRALGDPTRRGILRLLRKGSLGAGEIAEHFAISKATLSHHFRTLEEAGLVRSERRGTRVVYTLQANLLEELASELLDLAGGPFANASKFPDGGVARDGGRTEQETRPKRPT